MKYYFLIPITLPKEFATVDSNVPSNYALSSYSLATILPKHNNKSLSIRNPNSISDNSPISSFFSHKIQNLTII